MKISTKPKHWLITLTLLLAWCGLSLLVAHRYHAAQIHTVIEQQRLITQDKADDLADSIRRNVRYLNGIPNMLSHLVRVNKAVALFGTSDTPSALPLEVRKEQWGNHPALHDLSLYLAVVQSNLSVDLVYLVDAAGDAIASSNWDQPSSTIGVNFAERDWFRSSREGKPGMQYAMGKTTNVAGLYFSSPVLQDGKFMGAVVVKIDVSRLSFLTSQMEAYITDQNGVIILAHDKSIELHALPDAAVAGLSEQKKFARYERSVFPALAVQSAGDKEFPELLLSFGKQYPHLGVSRALSEYGLTAHVESALVQLVALEREQSLFFMLMAGFGSALILAGTGMFFHLRTSNRAKQVLHDSEERLRMTLEHSPDAVFIWDIDERIVYVNDCAVALLGYRAEELLGSKIFDFAPADWREPYREEVRKVLAREEYQLYEVRLIKKDGGKIAMEANVVKLPNGQVYASCRDITERKRAEQLEQRQRTELEAIHLLSETVSRAESLEQMYEVAMDFMLCLLKADRAAIRLFDTDGMMRFKAWRGVSQAYLDVFDGHATWEQGSELPPPVFVEDIKVNPAFAVFKPAIQAEGISALGFIPLTQHGRLLGKFMVYFDAPHHFSEHDIQLALTIASHVAFAIDRKYAEQQFVDMFEFAPDAIVMTNMQAVITQVNHQAESLFAYSKHELIGQTIEVLIPKDRPEEKRNMRQRFLNSALRPRPLGGMSRKDLRAISKDGRIFPVEISLSPMHTQNGMVIAAAVRDVSARQQVMEQLMLTARELEEANTLIEQERAQLASRVEERTSQLRIANRAKDSFLATMSHEIRTPLGGLLGMMELLSLSALDGEQQETLQAARNSGKGLLRIVDDILDWSKIEAGKLQLVPRAAPILPMLKGVVATYGQLASAKGIQLSYRYDETLSQAHLFDPLRLSQILNNFTSNAIKFTSNGVVHVSASLSGQQEGYEEVSFRVSDTGMGIDQAHLERLFQQYEQASADTARMYGGTGLGLAICRSLAELMEGYISVESVVGQGSIFSFTVRLAVADKSAQRDLLLHQARVADDELPRQIETINLHQDGVAVAILVVDDHPVNRMLLKQQLEQLGLQAEVAAYGIVALALWQTGRYDLVITDCHMPEMDGYELTRCIRDIEVQDGRARTPVIAWTANVMAEEEVRCRAAGMDDLLTKPTELAYLRAMLLKWLNRAQLTAAPAAESSAVAASPAVRERAESALELGALQKIAMTPAQQIEMLQDFSVHNRNDMATLAAALQEGNPAAVAHGAHRIKGACRMVGARQLASLCAAIEEAAGNGELSRAHTIAQDLYEANAAFEQEVARFIQAQ